MAGSSFLDVCRFAPTLGGTTDWTYSAAVTGYQSPAAAGVVNGAQYSYRAESADLTQWEIGVGTYNTGTGVLTRGTVLFNSLGTTAKINFSTVPQVSLVALAEDLVDNGSWTAYTPTITSGSGTITTLGAVSGRFKKIGKTVAVQITVNITTAGTGGSALIATLPVNAVASTWQIGAAADLTTGNVGRSLILNSDATKAVCSANSGGTLISSGAVVIIGMTYEAA